ncbi:unnamed protein product [Leptosia nina]|uniref:Chitin-binding type-2 domain-containing protein n=1 Tax=Leptosia nina TaxID=320188 RepID=A0AAV1JC28_9NEOP
MWLKVLLLSIFGCQIILTYDLSGVISGNRMAGVPLGRSLGDGEVDVEGICTTSGMACQNCTHAVTCVPLPIGWLKVPLQQCSGEQSCNAHLGQCSSQHVPECDVVSQKYQHICEQVGIFPDAYDCRKFHLCSPPVGLPDGAPADHRVALCPRHYSYNPQTAQCSIPLQNGQCIRRPVPDCTRVGQSGALETSSNHYYVCLSKGGTLRAQIFICPHGWHFSNGYCRPELIDSTTAKSIDEPTKATRESRQMEVATTEKTTKVATSKIDAFFSTEKPVTYAADTFLADRFDLANYETFDETHSANDFPNSFEESSDFW